MDLTNCLVFIAMTEPNGGLFGDDTPVLTFEDPTVQEYPTIKYGLKFIAPIVVGLVVLGCATAVAVMYFSWFQETRRVAALEEHGTFS